MIPKPLKSQIQCFDGRPHKEGKHFEDCDMYFSVKSMKSAVEYLKEQIDNLYHKFPKGDVWRASNDTVCDMCEEYMIKKIDETFPDLFPSGDLIADKQNPQSCDTESNRRSMKKNV